MATGTLALARAVAGPHGGQGGGDLLQTTGASLGETRAAALLLHGRGASAASILALASEMETAGVIFVAPEAAGNTWYPNRFLAPLASNQPHLDSALDMVAATLETLGGAGIDPENVVLLGFSQGACLAAEFAVRHPRRYGGVVAFSGGLIGPPGTRWEADGDLEGTPVFLGCSDRDAHIPATRVEESAAALSRLGATVTTRFYPGMGHTVNLDEIEHARVILSGAARP